MPAATWSRRRAPSSRCASAARSSCSTTSASTSTRWTGSAGSWSSKRSWMRRTTRQRVAGEWPRSPRRSASARPTSSAPRTQSCSAHADNTTRAAGRRREPGEDESQEKRAEKTLHMGVHRALSLLRAPAESARAVCDAALYPASHGGCVSEILVTELLRHIPLLPGDHAVGDEDQRRDER